MTSQNSTDGKSKKFNPLVKITKILLSIFLFTELRNELRTIHKRLTTAIELVGNMDGKFKDKNPLKDQLNRNKIILFIVLLIPLCIVLFFLAKFPAQAMFEYVKVIPLRILNCIKHKEFNLDYVLAKDLVAYYVARSWAILFSIQLIGCFLLSKLIIKKSYMIDMTKKFKIQALKCGFIKEDGPGELLMTPVGLLINLEGSSEKVFAEDGDHWNQLNVYPGKVFNAKNQRTLIFVTIVQPMKDEYKYFENNNIEINR